MSETRNKKPLSELTLLDRFLFDVVMEDPQNARDILSIILGHDVGPLKIGVSERTIQPFYDARAIRLDLLSISNDDVIYDAEAQKSDIGSDNLRKRSRYYQGVLDASLLLPGETNFTKLQDVYIIFIAPFDIFGEDKYVYTFRMKCDEVPGLELNDRAVRLFLNTRGTNDNEVSAELIEFLHTTEKTLMEDDHKVHSDRLRDLIERVKQIKADQKVGTRYMRYLEEKNLEREKGRAEGKVEGLVEGKAEGMIKGRDAQLISDIKGMLEEGLSSESISRIIKRTPEQIQGLIQQIQAETTSQNDTEAE